MPGWRSRPGRRAAEAGDRDYTARHDVRPGSHMRGTWRARLPDIERELKDLSTLNHRHPVEPEFDNAAAEKAIAAFDARAAVTAGAEVSVAKSFKRGEPIQARLPASNGEAVLHHPPSTSPTLVLHADEQGRKRIKGDDPGVFTDTKCHIQCYVSVASEKGVTMSPGFVDDLSNRL